MKRVLLREAPSAFTTAQTALSQRLLVLTLIGMIKRICRISVPITASATVMSLVNIIDLTLIMRRLSDLGYSESVSSILYGNYTTLSIPMFNLVLSIVTSVTTASLPVLTEAFSKKANSFNKSAENLIVLVSFISIPSSTIFFFYPTEILNLLFDKGSVALGGWLLAALAPSILLITVLTALNIIIEASGGYNIPLVSMMVGCAFKLLATHFFVGNSNFAIWGAPIGTAISYIASITIAITYAVIKKRISVSLLKTPLITLFISLAAMAITKYLGYALSFSTNALSTVLTLLIFGTIYIAFSLAFGTMTIKKLKSIAN